MPDIFVSETKETKKHPPKKSLTRAHVMDHKSHQKFRYSPLASYMYYPKKAEFMNRAPHEQVILILRRHFITNLGWITVGMIMMLAPLVLKFFPLIDFLPGNFRMVAIMGWYLVTLAFVFEGFASWFFNVNIVTDERIIDVDFVNLVYRKISYAQINKIQDASVRMGSAIRTLFNYGDVIIQTAAEIPQIQFEAVPKPDKIVKVINDLIVEEEIEAMEGRIR